MRRGYARKGCSTRRLLQRLSLMHLYLCRVVGNCRDSKKETAHGIVFLQTADRGKNVQTRLPGCSAKVKHESEKLWRMICAWKPAGDQCHAEHKIGKNIDLVKRHAFRKDSKKSMYDACSKAIADPTLLCISGVVSWSLVMSSMVWKRIRRI
jgi:hypothetical protein